MAKVIIVVGSTYVEGGEAKIAYTVSSIKNGGLPAFSYASDYQVDIVLPLGANLLAWRNKIIAQVGERGVIVTAGDLIIFGGPV